VFFVLGHNCLTAGYAGPPPDKVIFFPAIWVEMPENETDKMTNTQWCEDWDAAMAFG